MKINSTPLLNRDLIVSSKTTVEPRGAEPTFNRTAGYVMGETGFESWDRLWKAFPSDPEVDGEEWLDILRRQRIASGHGARFVVHYLFRICCDVACSR